MKIEAKEKSNNLARLNRKQSFYYRKARLAEVLMLNEIAEVHNYVTCDFYKLLCTVRAVYEKHSTQQYKGLRTEVVLVGFAESKRNSSETVLCKIYYNKCREKAQHIEMSMKRFEGLTYLVGASMYKQKRALLNECIRVLNSKGVYRSKQKFLELLYN